MRKYNYLIFLMFLFIFISCSKQSGVVNTITSTTNATTYSKYSEIKDSMINNISTNINFFTKTTFKDYVGTNDWDDFKNDIITKLEEIAYKINYASNDNPELDKSILIEKTNYWNEKLNKYSDSNYSIIFNHNNLYKAYEVLSNNTTVKTYITKNGNISTNKEDIISLQNSQPTEDKLEEVNLVIAYSILREYYSNSNNENTPIYYLNYNNGDNFYVDIYYNYLIKKSLMDNNIAYIVPMILKDEENKTDKINLVTNEINTLYQIDDYFEFKQQLDVTGIKNDLLELLKELYSNYNSSLTSSTAEGLFETDEYINYLQYLKTNSSPNANVSILNSLFELVFLSSDSSKPSIREQINKLYQSGKYSDNTFKEVYTTLNFYYSQIINPDTSSILKGNYIDYCSVILIILKGSQYVIDHKLSLKYDYKISYY